jgi:branched-chain amino acid transport system permease protein
VTAAGGLRAAPRQLAGFAGVERLVGAAAVIVAAASPLLFSRFFVSFVLTQTLILGIAAAGLIFLSAYGGLVSLAQIALYGIAGFVLGNCVTHGETKGLNLGWNPWIGVVLGVSIATALALVFGAISSRSIGIYFLMITLTFAVITNLFFGQVTTLSGFGGISNIDSHTPGLIGSPDEHPFRLFYAALIVALLVYAVIRYVTRTPFGLSLQGIRDDPVRMSSLGYNIALHRTLAFGFAGFLSALGGVLFVWWNGHIDPATVDISATLDLLVIAVIGGLFRLEGAWLGALVFVVINNYVRNIGVLHHIGIGESRFHTLIGAIFLLIVVASPGGLLGLWDSAKRLVRRRAAAAEAA